MLKKNKILVIDDSETNLTLLNAILSRKGYEIIAAENAYEGLKKAEYDQPNLVILDLFMPKFTGFDFLEYYRNDAKSEIPVIIISGSSNEIDIKKTINLGANDYLAKPIDIPALVDKIEHYLTEL